jgi:hypothetical protein
MNHKISNFRSTNNEKINKHLDVTKDYIAKITESELEFSLRLDNALAIIRNCPECSHLLANKPKDKPDGAPIEKYSLFESNNDFKSTRDIIGISETEGGFVDNVYYNSTEQFFTKSKYDIIDPDYSPIIMLQTSSLAVKKIAGKCEYVKWKVDMMKKKEKKERPTRKKIEENYDYKNKVVWDKDNKKLNNKWNKRSQRNSSANKI